MGGVSPAPDMVSSTAKIGAVTSVMFRKVYGRAPDDLFWQAKGFMAGAQDKRGNQLTVHQYNDDMRPGFDPKTGTFPLVKINHQKS